MIGKAPTEGGALKGVLNTEFEVLGEMRTGNVPGQRKSFEQKNKKAWCLENDRESGMVWPR